MADNFAQADLSQRKPRSRYNSSHSMRPSARMLDRFSAIIRDVGEKYGASASEIQGRCRRYSIVAARREAIQAIAAEFPLVSSVSIAAFFGVDHTAVLYHLGRLKSKPLGARNASSPTP